MALGGSGCGARLATKVRSALRIAALAGAVWSAAAPLAAQIDGFADPTFGNYGPGFSTIAFDLGGELRDRGQAIAVDRFDRVLIAGSAETSNSPFHADAALARYLADGTPDSNFNFGGQLHWDFLSLGFDSELLAVGELSDGSLVAAGVASSGSNSYPIAALVSPTGVLLDQRIFGFPLYSGFTALAVQSDDKIVVAGYVDRAANYAFLVERLNPDFSLDLGFGQQGRTFVDFDLGMAGFDDDLAWAVALQKDGRILVAGSAAYASFDDDMAVARLTPAGALDPTFGPGGTGKATAFFDLSAGDKRDSARGVAADPLGRILLGGSAQLDSAPFSRAAFARLDSAGFPDPTFGNQGSSGHALFPGLDNVLDGVNGIAVQSDGKLVAAGTGPTGTARGFSAARLTAAGALDSGWGGGFGVVSYQVFYTGANDLGLGIALQAGRAVLVGTADVSSGDADTDIALVRLESALIFSDDFESGATLQWSLAAP